MVAPVAPVKSDDSLFRLYWAKYDPNGSGELAPARVWAVANVPLAGILAGECAYRPLDVVVFASACYVPAPHPVLLPRPAQRLLALRDHLVQMFPEGEDNATMKMMAFG